MRYSVLFSILLMSSGLSEIPGMRGIFMPLGPQYNAFQTRTAAEKMPLRKFDGSHYRSHVLHPHSDCQVTHLVASEPQRSIRRF